MKNVETYELFWSKPKNIFLIFTNKWCQRFDNICVKNFTGLLCLNSCKYIKKSFGGPGFKV